MRRIFTICLLFLAFTLQAQDLKSLYIAIPDSLSPLLTKINRQDFGDFLSSNMKAEVSNRLGNNSEMLKLTEDYSEIKLTSVSKVEMKLLPINDSTKVICLTKTYNGPVSDSHIAFYSTDWQELTADQFIQMPDKNEFFIQSDMNGTSDSLNYVKKQIEMYLVKINLSDKDQTMKITFTAPELLDKKNAEIAGKYLRKSPLLYEWKEGRFVKTN